MGNFIFIDSYEANYQEKIKEALVDSLNIALQGGSTKVKILVENADFNFTQTYNGEQTFTFESTVEEESKEEEKRKPSVLLESS